MSPLCSGISHVGLTVSSLEASRAFFEALGFAKIGESPSYPAVFLSEASSGSIITLWQASEGANEFDRKSNVGLHHLAMKVPSEEALDAAYEAVLKVPGATSEFSPEPFGFGKHAMVLDPSGVRVELAYHKE
jgi:catechol 2,3-dioxygenase-like lactoylglutathione lyase family enzyme